MRRQYRFRRRASKYVRASLAQMTAWAFQLGCTAALWACAVARPRWSDVPTARELQRREWQRQEARMFHLVATPVPLFRFLTDAYNRWGGERLKQ